VRYAYNESPQDNYILFYSANGLLDAGLPRYNTPPRYLDSTTKKIILSNQKLTRTFDWIGTRTNSY